MSRALVQATTKVVPSISSSATASAQTSAFSTTSTLEGRNNREKRKASVPLILPPYSKPSKIKYEAFVRDLQKSNAKLKEVTQADVQRALRQYFTNFFGRKGFEDVQKDCRFCEYTDKDKASWARLREESQQYWQRR